MSNAILGIKKGMTQVFQDTGEVVPVTVIAAGPCIVLQKKTVETDGYNAIQVGFYEAKPNRVNKPMKGHFAKAGNNKVFKYIKEFRIDNVDQYEVGQAINVEIFNPGDKVDVTAKSKGKGFAGSIKRHNFGRGPTSHGSKYHRGTGSLSAKGPARVFKGRKMPGRMGGEKVTTLNLEIVKVFPGENLLLVKGAVPGPSKGLVYVKNSVKTK
ncbi:50S ribosomal protein L3 [Desulfitibacter alkalitolerans]|uniref:50S ribosomal protein L3 n=1 Tax=Desulfitibacter alkalitolerans TaxID=264641 RepID=UPI000486158B|nr:50S ribosomal protein L3 [Desulfitibacter alkalitolerans]